MGFPYRGSGGVPRGWAPPRSGAAGADCCRAGGASEGERFPELRDGPHLRMRGLSGEAGASPVGSGYGRAGWYPNILAGPDSSLWA